MATTVSADARARQRTLTSMVRAMFPHDRFPDGPYERAAQAILDGAADDPRSEGLIRQGLVDLDAAAGEAGAFADLDGAAALELLRGMAGTPFFELVRAKVVLTLYDDHEVWELLGYQGPSLHRGGYAPEEYADLRWLPAARVEEAS
jgi:hypothetical protein